MLCKDVLIPFDNLLIHRDRGPAVRLCFASSWPGGPQNWIVLLSIVYLGGNPRRVGWSWDQSDETQKHHQSHKHNDFTRTCQLSL